MHVSTLSLLKHCPLLDLAVRIKLYTFCIFWLLNASRHYFLPWTINESLRFAALALSGEHSVNQTIGQPVLNYTTGINSNGDMTIVKNNFIINAKGAGVRLGGYEVDGVTYGLESQVISYMDIQLSG